MPSATDDELLTVEEFIRLTENSYGGSVIRKLKEVVFVICPPQTLPRYGMVGGLTHTQTLRQIQCLCMESVLNADLEVTNDT